MPVNSPFSLGINHKMLRLALFISGGGTTASFIIRESHKKSSKITSVLVVASKEKIAGIESVQSVGFPKKNIYIINPLIFKNSEKFGSELIRVCKKFSIDIIGQYGWLPLTPNNLIAAFKNRIINQHPGPLDQRGNDFGGKGMYGRRVHAAVLSFRRSTKHDYWTEATSHFVTSEFDKGGVIGRKKITIDPADTVESLQAKLLPFEHKLQFEVLQKLAKNNFRVFKRIVPLVKKTELQILKNSKETAALLYPKG